MRNELAEVNPKMIMGVGSGGGNLFVEGDYDSIKTLQDKLLELEKLRRENTELKQKLNIKENFDILRKSKGIKDTKRKTMTFSKALEEIKAGKKVTRGGWNGKDMFIFLVPGSTFKVNRAPLLGIYEEGTEVNYHAHIDMKTVDDMIVPWLASQTDLLQEDWVIVA